MTITITIHYLFSPVATDNHHMSNDSRNSVKRSLVTSHSVPERLVVTASFQPNYQAHKFTEPKPLKEQKVQIVKVCDMCSDGRFFVRFDRIFNWRFDVRFDVRFLGIIGRFVVY